MAFWSKKKLNPLTPLIPPRWTPFVAHTYEAKELPSPGAGNYAYENLGLVEFTFIGAAVHNRGAIKPLQPPQLYAFQQVMASGLGGLSAGQIIGQPLVNPYAPGMPSEGE